MPSDPEPDPVARHRRIAVIMFAVLVASVLAAWGLTLATGRLTRHGAKVLTALRQSGAGSFWSPDRQHWTLTTEKGKPVGWSYYAHRRKADGTYRGIQVNIEYVKGRPVGHWATWTLSENLHSSLYNAGTVVVSSSAVRLTNDTTTTFKDGSIHLNQRVKGGVLRSQAGAGDNYIPEGAWPLVRAMVAREKTEAKFEIIYDYDAPKDGVIQFNKVIMEYQGVSERIEGASVVSERGVGSGRGVRNTIDSGGFALTVQAGDRFERRVGRAAVLRSFRSSDAILRSVLEQAPQHWPEPEVPIDPNELSDVPRDGLDANAP